MDGTLIAAAPPPDDDELVNLNFGGFGGIKNFGGFGVIDVDSPIHYRQPPVKQELQNLGLITGLATNALIHKGIQGLRNKQ